MRAPNAVDQFASYGSTEEPVDNHDGKRVLGLVPLSRKVVLQSSISLWHYQ